MKPVIVTDVPRPALADLDALAPLGVATVHEALGRTGCLGPRLRPIQQDVRIAGSAVTALCWPGDNLMIHAAVEQCREGDVLVVTTTGIRDTADLRAMGFPAWSAAVSAQGTVKATAGAVNVPVGIGGQVVRPGDAVLADDDGVMVVARAEVPAALEAAHARVAKEEAARAAFRAGELGLDRYAMRPLLDRLGVCYVSYQEYAEGED